MTSAMIEQRVLGSVSSFRAHNELLHYQTTEAPQFVDITDDVAHAVDQSGVENGVVTIFSRHTTAAIKINECEPELLKDMARFLCEMAPLERDYFHNDFTVRTVNMEEDECPNAHSHCQHLMLNASESVPIVEGKMELGRWQRLFLVELDRPKPRQVSVQILGI
jgi:secondary thiamine-phosphate synthase enzyme